MLTFCFSRQNSQWHSNYKFHLLLPWLWLQCQFCFQSLFTATRICPMCVLVVASLRLGQYLYLSSVSKVCILYSLGSEPHMHSSVVSLVVHKQIYKISFSSFSLQSHWYFLIPLESFGL